MIIIKEQTEMKLTETLEMLRTLPNMGTTRIIHFNLSKMSEDKNTVELTRTTIITSVQRSLSTMDPQIYLCEDGDIFVLALTLPIKEATAFITDVIGQCRTQPSDEFTRLYELKPHANTLLMLAEQKIEQRRKVAENIRKQQETMLAEHRRESILSFKALDPKTSDMDARRKQHNRPELMIIEDDVFSRRLVENVLERQYSLTGLGSAEHALRTYVHLAPDVLFLDIDLPDVTGHELLKKIIAFDPKAYVIMISGNADRGNILQAMNEGAKGFIAKPFSREKIFQYIERCPTIHTSEGKSHA